MRPHRVFAYVRVSSPAQARDGSSLDGQRGRIVSWCTERGYPAPTFLVEVESGVEEKRERRVQLDRLLETALPGDLVLVSLVDRLGRDLFDGIKTARQLVRAGVGLVAIDEEGGPIDAGTVDGMDRLEQQLMAAQREARRIRTRTVGARRRLQDQGFYVSGTVSFGYRRGSRAEKRQLCLDVVAEEAPIVVALYERATAGASLDDLQEWAELELVRPFRRDTIRQIIRSRLYLGQVKDSRGEWIAGRHAAIVTRDLWERANEALRERRKGGRKPSDEARTAGWLLRGLASCPECGGRMSAAYSRNEGYYVCWRRLRPGVCSGPYVWVPRADARASELALGRLAELRELLARPSTAGGSSSPRPRDFAAERSRVAAQLARAEDGWVRGVLSDDALGRTRARLDEELGRIEVAAAEAARAERANDPLARRAALADVRRLAAAWKAAPVAVRRTALAILAKTIRLHPDEVEIEWRGAEELTATGTAHLFAGPDDVPPRRR